jgi:hypothetical protein
MDPVKPAPILFNDIYLKERSKVCLLDPSSTPHEKSDGIDFGEDAGEMHAVLKS